MLLTLWPLLEEADEPPLVEPPAAELVPGGLTSRRRARLVIRPEWAPPQVVLQDDEALLAGLL